jgi:septal ring factor EnvC (AmiA/AmiB activator)
MSAKRLAWFTLPLALGAAALLAGGAEAQRASPGDLREARSALRDAQAAARTAQARSALLERQAEAARGAAERTAHEAAALAARVQAAEAGIRAAEARLELARQAHAALREELGREQQPIVHLTGALQQFTRRPLALSVLQPGSVSDLVHLRAMLDGALPRIEDRTAALRSRLARARELREDAGRAAADLRQEQADLAARRKELAAVEARQRLAFRQAETGADREADRALALAEEARDLDALVGELDRAAALRQRLAALPGPALRPARPEEGAATAAAAPSLPAPQASATAPPAPYLLPVTGRTVLGFGARPSEGALPSRGLTLAPRPGAQVVAPAAGRVAFAGPYRGYGWIVIVEHPGGWTSLVTGLARTDVRVGQRLVAGAPLGVAAAASPEVTLELRRDGEPVNPLRFAG